MGVAASVLNKTSNIFVAVFGTAMAASMIPAHDAVLKRKDANKPLSTAEANLYYAAMILGGVGIGLGGFGIIGLLNSGIKFLSDDFGDAPIIGAAMPGVKAEGKVDSFFIVAITSIMAALAVVAITQVRHIAARPADAANGHDKTVRNAELAEAALFACVGVPIGMVIAVVLRFGMGVGKSVPIVGGLLDQALIITTGVFITSLGGILLGMWIKIEKTHALLGFWLSFLIIGLLMIIVPIVIIAASGGTE